MRNCGYEDLDLVPNGQMKLVVVRRNLSKVGVQGKTPDKVPNGNI
ncbi:hypothetical protein [Nostoc sp. WHI]|nr:hypothetical protein [Nostoc sp. WHI]